MASKPEYDRFEREAAEQIRQQQAIQASYQRLAQALFAGEQTDVRAGEQDE
jgi:hypothetical protein